MYMVTTTWRHDKPIDKVNMRKTLSGLKDRNNSNEVIDVMWFEIDEVTHGSVLIYSSFCHHQPIDLFKNGNIIIFRVYERITAIETDCG